MINKDKSANKVFFSTTCGIHNNVDIIKKLLTDLGHKLAMHDKFGLPTEIPRVTNP